MYEDEVKQPKLTMQEVGSNALGDEFDRAVRKFNLLRDTVVAGPSNERKLSPFINIAQDWTVTTYRERVERNVGGRIIVAMEDTILVTKGEGNTYTRLVIPPVVARILYRQYDQVSKKNRKRAAKANYEQRVADGFDPAENLKKARANKKRGKK